MKPSKKSCGGLGYLLRITDGSACFGLIAHKGVVVDAAPIGRRVALGKPAAQVVSYYFSRGAKVEVIGR